MKLTKLRTGRDVKKLYSDYFSTYMDNKRVTACRTQEGRAIELEVTSRKPLCKARLTLSRQPHSNFKLR